MGIFFSGRELVNIAIGFERKGVAFYDSLVSSTKDATARGTYQILASKQREHIEIFQKMLGSVGDYQPPETYTEEYDLYLKALVDSVGFSDEQIARGMAKMAKEVGSEKVGSEAVALQIGMGAEEYMILFYSEMRVLVRRSDREVLNRIIEEGRSHLRKLLDLKRSLSKR